MQSTPHPTHGQAPRDVAALLALSDERDVHLRRLLDAERDAYGRGYADGRADQARKDDRAWAHRPLFKLRDAPAYRDLEAARWTLRGQQRTRETFGDPHPDDYTGPQERAA